MTNYDVTIASVNVSIIAMFVIPNYTSYEFQRTFEIYIPKTKLIVPFQEGIPFSEVGWERITYFSKQ